MPTSVRTSWLRRRQALQAGAVLVVLLAAWRTAETHTLLSHTVDEPTHIASGLEWILHGTQRLHPENPPLGRIGDGLGSFLAGYAMPATGTAPQRGTELLYTADRYLHNLAMARWATLPFFCLVACLVWRWADQIAGPRAAFLATAAVSTLPPLLGHSGLATTDVPFVATFLLLLWVFVGWLESPELTRSITLGLVLGLSSATKFSTLVFFPPAALVVLVAWRLAGRPSADHHDSAGAGPRGREADWGRLLLGGLLSLPIAALVVWGAYRFDVGSVGEIEGARRTLEIAFPDEDGAARLVAEEVARLPLPAPGALYGLFFLKAHTVLGHTAYALGRQSEHGFWYFYPLALAVKTPLSFGLLVLVGVVGAFRERGLRRWRVTTPALAAAAVLLVSTLSTINIGLRHVLVVYPLLAISVGLGADALLSALDRRRREALVLLLGVALGWQLVLLYRVFPDYLAFFNALARPEPGRILVDSDLDWGQDALQLEAATRRLGVPLLNIAYFGSVRLCELDLPDLDWLPPGKPVTGWVAISEMYYRDDWRVTYSDVCDRSRGASRPDPSLTYDWLRDHEPVAFAGPSIRLYHIEGERLR